MISQKTSTDLFNKIRSKFGNITIGDDTGSATADPSKAVFFDFEYTDKDDEYFNLGLAVLDLTKQKWETSNTQYSREDLIDIGRDYEKGMGY